MASMNSSFLQLFSFCSFCQRRPAFDSEGGRGLTSMNTQDLKSP
jgi:hypothetical protein